MNFLDFFKTFFSEYAALLFSAIALIISLKTAQTADKARLFTASARNYDLAIRLYEKRSETLNELDKQNALFSTILFTYSQKLFLFSQYPQLAHKYPEEHERLTHNSSVIESLRTRYDEQRQYSEKISEGNDLTYLESTLAEIRKLTIHIQEDVKKEQAGLDLMLKQCKGVETV